jgi:hypothetical protein
MPNVIRRRRRGKHATQISILFGTSNSASSVWAGSAEYFGACLAESHSVTGAELSVRDLCLLSLTTGIAISLIRVFAAGAN